MDEARSSGNGTLMKVITERFLVRRILHKLGFFGARARREIDRSIPGYSGGRHWFAFRELLAEFRPRRVCMIGVYHGRDIAYLCALADELGLKDFSVLGVDKFDDTPCADWPADKRAMGWQEAGMGTPPNLLRAQRLLEARGLSSRSKLIQSDDAGFLQESNETFDIIYIDTSHDYESVKNLIRLAAPRLAEGGLIAGDDFADSETWGVERAVKESFREFRLYAGWIWAAKKSGLVLG